jgi:para-aminobenzoate synthetase component 1
MSRKGRDVAVRSGKVRSEQFMQSIRFEDWKRWQQEGCSHLPAGLVVRGEAAPQSWSAFSAAPVTVLLESAQSGRYSYMCDRPARIIVGEADAAQIRAGDGTTQLSRRSGTPLEILAALLAEKRTPRLAGWPAMTGGLIGAFGYDLVRTWERLPIKAKRDLGLPLYAMIEPQELFVYDRADESLAILVWCDLAQGGATLEERFEAAQVNAAAALRRWRKAGENHELPTVEAVPGSETSTTSFTPAEFCAAVRRIQEYISAGDTYQVNLSLRTSRGSAVPPEAIYEALRRVNPSPYMGLLRFPEFALVCGSPELLVHLENGLISSRPIAGTRRRGTVAGEDSQLSVELLANEKERAEHLMLVDLIRNDIGRVAAFGSVTVREFMVLERYSHVMHIVSQVEGQLAAGRNWADVVKSMFPGGTITGCPKIRTMEIIEELEPVGRGFYTGALGWISDHGEMEFNIVIRSMLVQDGVVHVQAGAGIVADSKPERELDEALRKAEASWVALREATQPHA